MARTLPHPVVALAFTAALAALSSGCDRSAPPIAPEPVPARGPGPAAADRATEPPPPPKAAPANQGPDAPSSPTAAAPVVEDKPPALAETPEKPAAPEPAPSDTKPAAVDPKAKRDAKSAARAREIRPSEPGKGCIEMYGTCTPPPDRVCTSSAFYLDCGERGQVPNSREWVHCVCP